MTRPLKTTSQSIRTPKRRILGWILGCLLALAPGCEGGEGGLGVDRLEVRRCGNILHDGGIRCHAEEDVTVFEPFTMPLRFLGLVVVDNKGFVRMSPLDRTSSEGDQALIVIHDVTGLLENTAGSTPAVLSVGAEDADAALSLVLLGQCECPHDPLVATSGELRFTLFGTAPGARLAGDLTDVVLTNLRTGEVVASDFHGSFNFAVVTTTPWQPFSNPPAHED